GVQLSVGDRFLHLLAEGVLFLVTLEPALDAVLDSHFRPQRMSAERSSPTISAVSSDFDLYFKSVFPTLRSRRIPSRYRKKFAFGEYSTAAARLSPLKKSRLLVMNRYPSPISLLPSSRMECAFAELIA